MGTDGEEGQSRGETLLNLLINQSFRDHDYKQMGRTGKFFESKPFPIQDA